MRTVNLGILAHVDAGKTSLTERLLYTAGVIREVGSVDAGNTQTDSLALERQRGITIKSAVVSFRIADTTVNLIDTPGHPDFIAEVERVLSVLDGAVLVVSAVEGVQAQTRVLMRALQRLRIPTILFVNKIDRRGADPERVLRELGTKLTPAVVAMNAVTSAGTRDASVTAPDSDPDAVIELLTAETRQGVAHPVYFGSAITGAGVDALTGGIAELLPSAGGDPHGPITGRAFKIERGPAGEKIAYVRLNSGTVRMRDRLPFARSSESKVTAISVFDQGATVRRARVSAGEIAQLWGLAGIKVGDPIGPVDVSRDDAHHFAPPSLETVVVPADSADRGRLQAALVQLAEQDPLINLRQDDIRQELFVSLYGEVLKEVIQATLADEYGVAVTFRETTTICIEHPDGAGEAVEFIGVDPNPFLATVGLRVEPGPVGSGVRYRLGVEPGSMPPAFFKAVEETVYETLEQGRHGWRVTDCVVTMTHSGYWARQSHSHGTFDKSMSSTAGDFRKLTPLVLMAALQRAGTRVYEPIHRFRLEFPGPALPGVLRGLAEVRAVPLSSAGHGELGVVEGHIPAAQVHSLQQRLPTLTRGDGVLESEFDHYQLVPGAPPERARWDHNPLNRREYLLQVVRRVG
ncbi:MAG TPA: translation factor GTPase family protein [Jatrophihabitantaceae bacterium]